MLTERERACLEFLADKMEAGGEAIGRAAAPGAAKSARGYAMIGNGEARRLSFDKPPRCSNVGGRTRPLWSITPAGRRALAEQAGGESHGDR